MQVWIFTHNQIWEMAARFSNGYKVKLIPAGDHWHIFIEKGGEVHTNKYGFAIARAKREAEKMVNDLTIEEQDS